MSLELDGDLPLKVMKHIHPKTSHASEGRRSISAEDRTSGAPSRPVESLMTPKEVAERLNVSVRTVSRLVQAGEIRCLRIGKQRRFDPRAIAAYEQSAAKVLKRRRAGPTMRSGEASMRPKASNRA